MDFSGSISGLYSLERFHSLCPLLNRKFVNFSIDVFKRFKVASYFKHLNISQLETDIENIIVGNNHESVLKGMDELELRVRSEVEKIILK